MTTEPTRDCRYQHGPLVRVDGWFSLPEQDVRRVINPATKLSVVMVGGPTGRALVLQAWRCPVCGYLELQDVEL